MSPEKLDSAPTTAPTEAAKIQEKALKKDVERDFTENANTLKVQAAAIRDYIKNNYSQELAKSPTLQRIVGQTQSSAEGGGSDYLGLEWTQIRSLFDHVIKGEVYNPDGAFDGGERKVLAEISAAYKTDKDLQKVMQELYPVVRSGSSLAILASSKNEAQSLSNRASVVKFLSTLGSDKSKRADGQGGFTVLSGKAIESILTGGDDSIFIKKINNALIANNAPAVVDFAGLVSALKSNPSLKFAIIDGLGILDLAKLNGAKEGISTQEKEVVKLVAEKAQAGLNDAEKTALAVKGLTPDQQKQIIADFSKARSELARPEVAISMGLSVSNVGASLGITGAKAISDKATVFAGVSYPAAITFGVDYAVSKRVDGQTSVSLSGIITPIGTIPMVGLNNRAGDWTQSINFVPGGTMVSVGRDFRDAQKNNARYEQMARSSEALNADVATESAAGKKVADMSFKELKKAFVTGVPEGEKAGYTASAETLFGLAKNILTVRGFDTVTDPAERTALVYNSIRDAARDRQFRLVRDFSTNGTSLTRAGLTAGVIAHIPFVFPSLGFSTNKMHLERSTVIKETVAASKKEKKFKDSEFQSTYLTGAPTSTLSADGKKIESVSYSFKPEFVKLLENANLTKEVTRVENASGSLVWLAFTGKPKIEIVDGQLVASIGGPFDALTFTQTKWASQEASMVKNLANSRDSLDKATYQKVRQAILYISHAKSGMTNVYPANQVQIMQDFTKKIANMDYSGAKKELEKIEKNNGAAKYVLTNWDKAVAPELMNTFAWGSQATRAIDPSKVGADKVNASIRTTSVVAAEDRLANRLGIPNNKNREAALRRSGSDHYVPVDASSQFIGQEMSLAVFATPSNGNSRLDYFDGSLKMSNKVVPVTDEATKRSLITNMIYSVGERGTVLAQLAKLNTFLSGQWITQKITKEQYTEYLVTEDIAKLGLPADKNITAVTGPKFVQGLAMTGGNLCMNRVYGVGYPVLKIGDRTQSLTPVTNIDASETITTPGQNIEETGTAFGYDTANFGLAAGYVEVPDAVTVVTPPSNGGITTTTGTGQGGAIATGGTGVGSIVGGSTRPAGPVASGTPIANNTTTVIPVIQPTVTVISGASQSAIDSIARTAGNSAAVNGGTGY